MSSVRRPPKVHSESAQIARKFGREELGLQDVKVRKATREEQFEGAKAAGFDVEQIRDSVVISGRDGREFLLAIDLDPALSRARNAESGLLTLKGLVPVVGAPVVAAFAVKDIAKAHISMAKAKKQGEAADPRDQALARMGYKHLGLSGLSFATHGASHAMHLAHLGVQAAEVTMGTSDLREGKQEGSGLKGYLHAMVTALQGIAGVHHHEHTTDNDPRVIVVQMKGPDGSVEKKPTLPKPNRPVIDKDVLRDG